MSWSEDMSEDKNISEIFLSAYILKKGPEKVPFLRDFAIKDIKMYNLMEIQRAF